MISWLIDDDIRFVFPRKNDWVKIFFRYYKHMFYCFLKRHDDTLFLHLLSIYKAKLSIDYILRIAVAQVSVTAIHIMWFNF